jgi:hypothetical protein
MDNLALSQGGNLCFTSGGLVNGTNAGTIQTGSTITYTIDGEFKSKSATNNVSIAYTGPAVYGDAGNGAFTGQTGGSTRLYGVYLDGAGNFSVLPGAIANTARLAAGSDSLQFPPTQRNRACCGVVRVAVTANTTFVPGTTALNASGVTVSYLNLSAIPGEPLRA